MNNIFNRIRLILLIAAIALPAMASAQTDTVGAKIHYGFNALAYRLQKPSPNPRYKDKRFGDHMFVTADIAPTFTHASYGRFVGTPDTGLRGTLSIGDWFTPVHGMRMGLVFGERKDGVKQVNMCYGFSIDYLMNFTMMPLGANPLRKFEAIGVFGIDYQNISQKNRSTNAFGVHLGMQARYNVTPTFFIYAEPRFGIFSDNVNAKIPYNGYLGYDWEFAAMFGLGYRMNPGIKRFTNRIDNSSFIDNTFFGIGAGVDLRIHPDLPDLKERAGIMASMQFGKWTSSISGFRIKATSGKFGGPSYGYHKYTAFNVDYLFNINSAVNGYNPSERFNINLAVGPVAAFNTIDSHALRCGLGIGVQGVLNLNENLQLTLEPRADIFNGHFAPTPNKSNILGSLALGLQYRLGSYTEDGRTHIFGEDAFEEFLRAKKLFFSMSLGMMNHKTQWLKNFCGTMSLGKWFTQVSAWRVSLNTDIYAPHPYVLTNVSADYMLSLGTLFLGYNPDRRFDINAYTGLSVGGSVDNEGSHFIYGIQTGAQARYAVTPQVDIFFEPQYVSSRTRGDRFPPEQVAKWRLMLGFNYYFNTDKDRRGNDSHSESHSYLLAAAGPSIFGDAIFGHTTNSLSGSTDISFGHRFSDISAVQVGIQYDFISRKHTSNLSMGNLHVDYLLDITELFSAQPVGRFHISPLVGLGLGWGKSDWSKAGIALHAGAQLRWECNSHLDLVAEPRAMFIQQKVCNTTPYKHNFATLNKLLLGVAYKF